MFICISQISILDTALFSSVIFFLCLKTWEQYWSNLYSSHVLVQLFQQEVFEQTKLKMLHLTIKKREFLPETQIKLVDLFVIKLSLPLHGQWRAPLMGIRTIL